MPNKKAGRPPLPAAKPLQIDFDTKAIAADQKSADELVAMDHTAQTKTAELAAFLGYDGPLQPELLMHGIGQQMRRTVEACLETGKMLLLLKERVGHGAFQQALEHIGVAPRAAQKLMQAAYKFANTPSAAHLKKAIGSGAKLIEMLVLDEEEIKELSESGSVLGITVDAIDTMSRSELRAALREAREDTTAKDRLLDEKNKKLDKLVAGKKFQPTEHSIAKTQEQQAQLDELHSATNEAELTFMRLATVVTAIESSDVKAMRGRAAQAVQYIVARLADVIDENGIEVSLSEHIGVRPEWLNPLAGGTAAQG